MNYPIVDGRIQTRSLEVHITDHCNLRCAGCCSLSPFLPAWFLSPDDLRRDLELARRALKPRYFKLVGGEPLLHPRLLELLEVARVSGIAEIYSLTTNGLLLEKMPDPLFERLDHMTVSLYPAPKLPDLHLARLMERATRHGVVLNLKEQNEFQVMTLDRPRDDADETRRIYQTCWLRRRCHILKDGRFFTCTRPPHFQTYFRGRLPFAENDGVALHDGPSLVEELAAYFTRETPLDACARCMGGDGAFVPHRQLSPREVRAVIEETELEAGLEASS